MDALKLEDISEHMKKIDICMMTTLGPEGELDARPMSNNRDVDYNGDSYFFANGDASVVSELADNPEVSLAYSGKHSVLIPAPLFIALDGRAELVRDKQQFKDHWNADLDRWFEQGIDTPGLTMIHVKAERIKYWDGSNQGQINL